MKGHPLMIWMIIRIVKSGLDQYLIPPEIMRYKSIIIQWNKYKIKIVEINYKKYVTPWMSKSNKILVLKSNLPQAKSKTRIVKNISKISNLTSMS
jgi:hypothetical protein